MCDDLDRVLAEASLIVLALGIALGWSLFQVARGVAEAVNGLLSSTRPMAMLASPQGCNL